MGFRTGAFCKVWTVEPVSNTMTKGRISISRKNKNTGEYDQEFSGYVSFVGTAAAQKGLKLKEGDRIKLGDVDVTNTYNKEKGITYTNFKIFSFDTQEEIDGVSAPAQQTQQPDTSFLNVEEGFDESLLPF